VKSRLPTKPQPVPPIFQPEVAADAIVWAADHDRPEVYVGWPTVKAIVGDKIAPQLLDHYLARTGYQSQQTDEPADPNRRDNLWQPVPGDRGAHGEFDSRSRSFSWYFWFSRHRGGIAVLTGAVLGIVALIRGCKGEAASISS